MKCSSARWRITFLEEHKNDTLHHIPSQGVWLRLTFMMVTFCWSSGWDTLLKWTYLFWNVSFYYICGQKHIKFPKIIVIFIVRHHCQKHLGLGNNHFGILVFWYVTLDCWVISFKQEEPGTQWCSVTLQKSGLSITWHENIRNLHNNQFSYYWECCKKLLSRGNAVSITELCIRMGFLQMGCSVWKLCQICILRDAVSLSYSLLTGRITFEPWSDQN